MARVNWSTDRVNLAGSPDTNLAYRRTASYDAGGRVTGDVVTSVRSDGTFAGTTTYYYNATESSYGSGLWDGVATGGSYMGGAVTATQTVNTKNGSDSAAADTSLITRLAWRDGAVEAKTTYDGDTGSSSNALWTTLYYRDGSGYLTSAVIDDDRDRTVSFVNDAEGRVLQRDENCRQLSATRVGESCWDICRIGFAPFRRCHRYKIYCIFWGIRFRRIATRREK